MSNETHDKLATFLGKIAEQVGGDADKFVETLEAMDAVQPVAPHVGGVSGSRLPLRLELCADCWVANGTIWGRN